MYNPETNQFWTACYDQVSGNPIFFVQDHLDRARQIPAVGLYLNRIVVEHIRQQGLVTLVIEGRSEIRLDPAPEGIQVGSELLLGAEFKDTTNGHKYAAVGFGRNIDESLLYAFLNALVARAKDDFPAHLEEYRRNSFQPLLN